MTKIVPLEAESRLLKAGPWLERELGGSIFIYSCYDQLISFEIGCH